MIRAHTFDKATPAERRAMAADAAEAVCGLFVAVAQSQLAGMMRRDLPEARALGDASKRATEAARDALIALAGAGPGDGSEVERAIAEVARANVDYQAALDAIEVPVPVGPLQ